jgi:hypothetical protein
MINEFRDLVGETPALMFHSSNTSKPPSR